MRFCLDTHTHTLASGHAYSTIWEMVGAAREKGLALLAITEHAPAVQGSCQRSYFDNLKVLRGRDYGIEILFGAELDILGPDGSVDLEPDTLRSLDLCIASLHVPCFQAGGKEENTDAVIRAMENPYVDIIGHPDDGRIPLDYPRLVAAARENGIALELNNSSLRPNGFRKDARENDLAYLALCKEMGVPISLASDAHVHFDIADFSCAEEVLREADFPEDLLLNTSAERFKEYLAARRTKAGRNLPSDSGEAGREKP